MAIRRTAAKGGVMSTMHFIEEARPQDIETIAAFQVAHAREVESLALEHVRVSEGVARVFEQPALGSYVVAREKHWPGESRLIGTLLVTKEWSDWRARFFWWVQSLYVEPGHRRTGVARSLLRFVEEQAQVAGAAGLRLYVETRNARAEELYTGLGFHQDHYRMFEKAITARPHDPEP